MQLTSTDCFREQVEQCRWSAWAYATPTPAWFTMDVPVGCLFPFLYSVREFLFISPPFWLRSSSFKMKNPQSFIWCHLLAWPLFQSWLPSSELRSLVYILCRVAHRSEQCGPALQLTKYVTLSRSLFFPELKFPDPWNGNLRVVVRNKLNSG